MNLARAVRPRLTPEEVVYLLEVLESVLEELEDLLPAYIEDRSIETPEKLLQVTSTHMRKCEVLALLKDRLEVIAHGCEQQTDASDI